MPMYPYRCSKCGFEDEYIQKFSDPPLTVCEKCGGPLARKVTAASFHLKGGGWYKDGYASAKSDGGGDGKSDTTKSDTAATTTDSKPAATPAAAPAAPSTPKAAAE